MSLSVLFAALLSVSTGCISVSVLARLCSIVSAHLTLPIPLCPPCSRRPRPRFSVLRPFSPVLVLVHLLPPLSVVLPHHVLVLVPLLSSICSLLCFVLVLPLVLVFQFIVTLVLISFSSSSCLSLSILFPWLRPPTRSGPRPPPQPLIHRRSRPVLVFIVPLSIHLLCFHSLPVSFPFPSPSTSPSPRAPFHLLDPRTLIPLRLYSPSSLSPIQLCRTASPHVP